MRAPSLYGHFASKMDIVDGMFGQAWAEYDADAAALEAEGVPDDLREALLVVGAHWLDRMTNNPERNALMNQRPVPGFVPSEDSYGYAVAAMGRSDEWWPRPLGDRARAPRRRHRSLPSRLGTLRCHDRRAQPRRPRSRPVVERRRAAVQRDGAPLVRRDPSRRPCRHPARRSGRGARRRSRQCTAVGARRRLAGATRHRRASRPCGRRSRLDDASAVISQVR